MDCQTSASSPNDGVIIDIAWTVVRGEAWHVLEHYAGLIAPTDDAQLSLRVAKLTGISHEDLADAAVMRQEELCVALTGLLNRFPDAWLVMHYARFELSFLRQLFADAALSFDFKKQTICTHRLAKLLLPGLSSYSLRAVAGFLGFPLGEKKRALAHLEATVFVWQELLKRLQTVSPDIDLLLRALQNDPRRLLQSQSQRGQSLDRLRTRRLSLPKDAGIYRFIDRSGRVLYVGKAKNLYDRVNSYFRGKKTKGARLNEMLAQAYEIQYELASCELEALIMENEAIKSFDPPYNRQLKTADRTMETLYWHDLLASLDTTAAKPPFSAVTLVSYVRFWRRVIEGLQQQLDPLEGAALLHEELGFMVEQEVLQAAWQRLQGEYGSDLSERQIKSYVLSLWKRQRERLQEDLLTRRQAFRLQQTASQTKDDDLAEDDAPSKEAEQGWQWTAETLVEFCIAQLGTILRQAYRSRWFVRLQVSALVLEQSDGQWVCCQYDPLEGRWSVNLTPRQPQIDMIQGGGQASLPRGCQLVSLNLQDRDTLAIIYSQIRQALVQDRRVFLYSPATPVLEGEALMTYII